MRGSRRSARRAPSSAPSRPRCRRPSSAATARRPRFSSSAWRSRMPASTSVAAGVDVRAQQRRQHLQRRGQDVGQHQLVPAAAPCRAGRRCSATPLACALARVDSTAAGSMSTASICARAEPRRARSPGCRSRSRSRARAGHAPARRAAAIQRRHMRVVGCVPVPKARPGSSRITCRACARRLVPGRHDPELGRDLDRRELRLRQPHPVLLRHRRDRRSTLAAGEEVLRLQQRAPPRSRRASSANSALTRERCQPSLGGGMPGSPNSACSASVCASASSTDTLQRIERVDSASLTALDRGPRARAGAARTSAVARSALVLRQPALPGSGCWCRRR